MPSLLTQHYRSMLGETFLGKLQYTEALEVLSGNGVSSDALTYLANSSPLSVLYLFIGRPQVWVDAANAQVSDTNPPVPAETIAETSHAVWRDMLFAKRCYTANMNFVAARVDWTTRTAYDVYDDQAADLWTRQFYVLDTSDVAEYRVYKCLWNNPSSAGDAALSTNSPSLGVGTQLDPKVLPDGYVWKFLYALPAITDVFLTTSWMPVYADGTVLTAAYSAPGRLPKEVPLLITSRGTGYSAEANTVVVIQGDGSGAYATNTGVAMSGGGVDNISLTVGGLGYTQITGITVTQGANASANARCIIPPYPNHGYDPITELGAKHVMVYARVTNDEGGLLTTTNDYRRIGLLINPIDANTGNVATADTYRQTTVLTFSSNSGTFPADTAVFNYTASANAARSAYGVPTATIVDIYQDDANGVLRLTNVNPAGTTYAPFMLGDVVKANGATGEGTISAVNAASILSPQLIPYRGELLYETQRRAVVRTNPQIEEFKVILPFGG